MGDHVVKTSVLLTAYNGSNHLPVLLESLAAQTDRDFTVLMQDDGSSDETPSLLSAVSEHDNRFVFGNEQGLHLGAAGNFLSLLRQSDADYILLCDQDDFWEENKIAVLKQAIQDLEAQYGTDTPLLVHSDCSLVNESGEQIGDSFFRHQGWDPAAVTLPQLLVQNNVTGCTLIMNAALRKLVSAHAVAKDLFMHDWFIALTAAAFGRIAFVNRPLTRYFLSGCTGHVTLCDEVSQDLRKLCQKAREITLFHPVYAHFGERIPREEAEDILGLEHGKKNLLFFGLIREYKGLDILLRAFGQLDEGYQLIVAGEPYGSFIKYEEIIAASPAKDRIKLFTHYIKDSEVKVYFSAADLAVLPYRTATQSGISAIANHFDVPMVVTDVGGLRQAVGDSGTGLVADKADEESILAEIRKYFGDENLRTLCTGAIKVEKERLSWSSFGTKLLDFADNFYKTQ